MEMSPVRQAMEEFRLEESGQDSIEYALLLAFIALAGRKKVVAAALCRHRSSKSLEMWQGKPG